MKTCVDLLVEGIVLEAHNSGRRNGRRGRTSRVTGVSIDAALVDSVLIVLTVSTTMHRTSI